VVPSSYHYHIEGLIFGLSPTWIEALIQLPTAATPPSTNTDMTQIPTPEISHLRSAGAMNTPSPNVQEPMGRMFLQRPLPVPPNQVPPFPQPRLR